MSKEKIESAIAALEAARGFIEGFEDDECQEGIAEMLGDIDGSIAALEAIKPARVLVTVSGGMADVETFGPVDYELLDFDNLKEDGLDFDQREERYQRDKRWLETGVIEADESEVANA